LQWRTILAEIHFPDRAGNQLFRDAAQARV